MKIIVAGCGLVGRNLAEQLSNDQHDVTVIDPDLQLINQVMAAADVQGVPGNAVRSQDLNTAMIESTDLMIAMTGSDEINILICLMAYKLNPNCRTIARVRDPIYYKEVLSLRDMLGLSMVVNPELMAAKEIARLVRYSSAIEVNTFCKGQVEMLKFKVLNKSALCGCYIKDISTKLHCNVLICIIERGDEVIIPNGNEQVCENDLISVVSDAPNVNRFLRASEISTTPIKSLMILGGGRTSHYLIEELKHQNLAVKVIEKDQAVCDDLAERAENAMIIHGDATDQELLYEEGIVRMDSVAAMTDIDEENVMLSLYARHATANKARLITKIRSNAYDEILKTLDVGSIILPKTITREQILTYIRAMDRTENKVETMYQLVDNRVEALEFRIREKNAVTDIPLRDLDKKDNLLICTIRRNGQTIIPKGNDRILVGDSVIVVTTETGLSDINSILKPRWSKQ